MDIFKMIPMFWIQRILWVLLSLFTVALLMGVLALFLPHTGVNYQEKGGFINRHLYRISGLFFQSNTAVKGEMKTQSSMGSNAISLDAWTLKALYSEGKDGFAIVLVSEKTHYMNLGDVLQGYTLVSIKDKVALLEHLGKQYKLSLEVEEKIKYTKKKAQKKSQTTEKLNVAALNAGTVSRAEINRRIRRPDLIWKDIKISIYRKGGDIAGFMVKSVKHNSIFHHLGLKRGDIIVSANGNDLDSLEGVQQLYKNIDKMTSLVLGVKRSGKIKELTYEIN